MSEHTSTSKDTQSQQITQATNVQGDTKDMASFSALAGQSISLTNTDPDNVLKLQRTLGNQTTMQLMGQSDTKINRMFNLRMADAIQRNNDVPKRPDSPDNGVEYGWGYQGDYGNDQDQDTNDQNQDTDQTNIGLQGGMLSGPGLIPEFDELTATHKAKIDGLLAELESMGGLAFFNKHGSVLSYPVRDIIVQSNGQDMTEAQHEYYLELVKTAQIGAIKGIEGTEEAERIGLKRVLEKDILKDWQMAMDLIMNYDDPRDFINDKGNLPPPLPDNAKPSAQHKHQTEITEAKKVGTAKLVSHINAVRVFYHGINSVPEDHKDEFETFQAMVNSDDWSWAVAGKKADESIIKRIVQLRIADLDQRDQGTSLEDKALGTADVAANVSGIGFTIIDGVETINRLKQGASGGDILADALQGAVLWILGKAFAGIVLGINLINLFNKHIRRMAGYKAAMTRLGVENDGTISEETQQDADKNRLANISLYAFKKTRRAVAYSTVKIVLKILKWISYAITLASGGTTAIITATTAIISDLTRLFTGFGLKIKGAFKALGGTRGKARQRNASELLALAIGGDDDALQTIMDVNPFDEVKVLSKGAWNATFGKSKDRHSTTLPKPQDKAQLAKWLSGRYNPYSKPEAQAALVEALAKTMKSQ